MGHTITHVELGTPNRAKAKEFYGGLFDWKFEEYPEMNYTLFQASESSGGGFMDRPDGPAHWVPYVTVDDLDAYTSKAKSLGAKVLRDRTEVPGMGWYAVLQDPTGGTFGLWQGISQD
jgi:predicted enzyme related to lactoylglutathione lyase